MRILLVSDWMSRPGGSEAYVVSLRDALRARGDDVTLLTCGPGEAGAGHADRRVRGTDAVAAQAMLQIYNPVAAAAVRSAVRELDPQVALVVAFAYHLSPAVFPALRGVPTALAVMDYKYTCPTGSRLLPDATLCDARAGAVCLRRGCVALPHWLRDQPRYALIRRAVAGADRVVCASRWVQRVLAASGIAAEQIAYPIRPPGPAFRRAPAASPTFVFCGRLSREKGVELLLRAFARLRPELPGARLRVVGDGPQRAELERLATALDVGDAVTFTGWLEPALVERHLVDAWALVAPSLWAEPFGLVALEAIVRGVPVVASATGGFGETIDDGVTGLLFPNRDEEALTRCMRSVGLRSAFPTHAIAPGVVARTMDAYGPTRHVERLGAVLAEISRHGARRSPGG
jgi:glycosyltransferase involved in cell wall biosynthesis